MELNRQHCSLNFDLIIDASIRWRINSIDASLAECKYDFIPMGW